jgi:hypothetical protein
VSPVRYELGFYIPEDRILHSYGREDLKSKRPYCILRTWVAVTMSENCFLTLFSQFLEHLIVQMCTRHFCVRRLLVMRTIPSVTKLQAMKAYRGDCSAVPHRLSTYCRHFLGFAVPLRNEGVSCAYWSHR